MEGAARRARREQELAILQAWHGEAFARTKRLKGLSDYLGEKKKAQTPEEMLAVFRSFQSRGAPMNIRQVN